MCDDGNTDIYMVLLIYYLLLKDKFILLNNCAYQLSFKISYGFFCSSPVQFESADTSLIANILIKYSLLIVEAVRVIGLKGSRTVLSSHAKESTVFT